MSDTRKAVVFIAITFAVSWIGLWLGAQGPTALRPLSWLALLSPAIGALTCSFLFDKGRRVKALGLRFRPNAWWLWGMLIALGVTVLTITLEVLFSFYNVNALEAMPQNMAAVTNQMYSLVGLEPVTYSDATTHVLHYAGLVALQIVVLTAVFGLSEELGWRGYLYHLWRRFGFWRFSFAVGLVWGLWHVPTNFIGGVNMDAERPVLSLLLFPVFTMLLSPLLTLVRDRGRSVWASCLLHGTFNALAALPMITLDMSDMSLSLHMSIGIVAFAVACLVIAVFQRRDPYRQAGST